MKDATNAPADDAKVWTEKQCAYMLSLHPDTLAKWRRNKRPNSPPWEMVDGRVTYIPKKVQGWIDSLPRYGGTGNERL